MIGQAGEGEALVDLSAGGDLSVKVRGKAEAGGEPFDLGLVETLTAKIESQISEHLGKLDTAAITQREIDKAMRKAEREIAKAQRRLQKETERAQEHARRAQERAVRAAKRAQARVARRPASLA